MQLRFRGSRRYAEHLGDLLVFVAFDIVQDEDAASAGRQACDCFFHVEHVARRERRSNDARVRVHPTRFLIVLLEARALSSLTLSRVEHHVDRQTMQPGSERALATKQPQLLPRTDEDVLCQLFGAGAVGDHAGAKREHSVDVLSVQPLERTTISSRRTRDVRITVPDVT